MNKYTYTLVAFCLLSFTVSAQKAYKVQKKQKNRYEAYPNPFDFRSSGWLFDAGITGTTTLENNPNSISGDTSISFTGKIRPGIQLNIGRYLSLKKGHKLIKYVDYNLGYKMLWNTEQQELTVNAQDIVQNSNLDNVAHYANLNLNVNNIISFSDYLFLQNSLGINADYRFATNTKGQGLHQNIQPDAFILQAHYKLGLGIMIDNNIALIPYIEIPIFNISPRQKEFSQLDYFNGSYQSFIVGVRLMLFRLGQKDCPTANGYQLDPNQKNGY